MKCNPTTFRGRCVSFAIKRNSVNHAFSLRHLFLTLILLSALLLLFAVNASAQQAGDSKAATQTTEKKVVSNGYYSYEVTGNADVDAENATKAKKEFFDKHPDQYQKMIREENPQKHVIDAKEFETMPAEKRANILAHPELYSISDSNQPK